MANLPIEDHVYHDLHSVLVDLLFEESAVLIEGARGSGKSTLMRDVATAFPATMIDLDDEAVLAAVSEDPYGALSVPG